MISFGRSHPRLSAWLLLCGAAVVMFALPGAAAAKKSSKKPKAVGRVYTETNGATNNQVVIFDRYAKGKLERAGAVSTGGKGGLQPQPGCTAMCPFLDTQGEVALTKDGNLLFVVNAGSNSITSFRATSKGLKRVSVAPSGGAGPNSLTIHGNLLYVLNANSDSIAGLRFNAAGKLTSIRGSVQPLTSGAVPGLPRQIGFDNTGKVILVTLLITKTESLPAGGTDQMIDSFPVNAAGVAGAGNANNSTAPFPFAFAFDGANQAVMAEAHDVTPGANGRVATFKITKPLGVSPIDTELTNGTAPCWVVVTGNSRYAYVVNTGDGSPSGGTVSELKISPSGKLTLIGLTTKLNEFLKTDEALSNDSRYLYVLSPLESGSSTAAGTKSHIDEYKVAGNGTLKLIGATPSFSVPGSSGLAAF